MDEQQQKPKGGFPGWAGPIVGPIVGGVLAYPSLDDGLTSQAIMFPTAVGLGFLAGLIVWYLDRKKGN